MLENDPTNIMAAFEILLEEIETEIEFVNRVGARAFEAGEYDKAKKSLERAAQLSGFRDKADALKREWKTLLAVEDNAKGSEVHAQRRNLGRLRRGLRTREEAYYRPILEALQELGGSAPMQAVLDRVLNSMKSVLSDVDFEPLTSDPEMPRWRNAAQWARHSMVKEGLLRSNSPRGVWEISDRGIQFLERTANAPGQRMARSAIAKLER